MVLEMLIGSSVESISYPYGLVNGRVKSIARDVGYTVGCSVHSGPATFGEDPFEIRRIAIKSGTGTCGFGLRLLPPYPRYEFLRWRAAQSIRGTKTNGYAHSSSRVPEAAIPANGGTHGS
jgi:hypothetical protein